MKAIIHWDHKTRMNHDNMRYMYQYWDYSCRGFGLEPSSFVFVDLEGTLAGLNPPNKIFDTLEEALDSFPDFIPVYIHGSGKTKLSEFNHPENAVYIFGPNWDSMAVPEDAVCVSIPAPDPVIGIDLFSHVALGIVLYDRFIK